MAAIQDEAFDVVKPYVDAAIDAKGKVDSLAQHTAVGTELGEPDGIDDRAIYLMVEDVNRKWAEEAVPWEEPTVLTAGEARGILEDYPEVRKQYVGQPKPSRAEEGQLNGDGSTPTEEMPTRVMPKDAKSDKDQKESLYSRFKRGVRRHMYETPVDMSPMGPTIQPEIPFEQWYEERQARKAEGGPGRLSAGVERIVAKAAPVTRKARETTVRVAERVGSLTDILDYAGNIALIDTAYYAGSAYARVHDTLEDARFGVTDRAKAVVAKGRNVKSRGAKQPEAESTEADDSYKALLDQVPDDYEERDRYADREFSGYDPAKVDLFKAYLEKQLRGMATVPAAGEAVRYSDSVGAVLGDMSNEFRFLHEYINRQASQPMDESILLNLRLSDVVKHYLKLDVAKIAPGYSERFG